MTTAIPFDFVTFTPNVLRLAANVRAAFSQAPKQTPSEVAATISDVLKEISETTEGFRRITADLRKSFEDLATFEDLDLEVNRERLLRMSENLGSLHGRLEPLLEEGPIAQLARNVLGPYNDAVREFQAAVFDARAKVTAILALADAEDAEDLALAHDRLDDGEQPVAWESARANLVG